jgi:hypothetical protein
VFAFYNDRGECENRIEEFKNGFRADRLSGLRFLRTWYPAGRPVGLMLSGPS